MTIAVIFMIYSECFSISSNLFPRLCTRLLSHTYIQFYSIPCRFFSNYIGTSQPTCNYNFHYYSILLYAFNGSLCYCQ